MPGMRQSMKTRSYGSVASCCLIAAIASSPEATVSDPAGDRRQGVRRISRAAALSSTTSTRSCGKLLGDDLAAHPSPAPTPSQTVK